MTSSATRATPRRPSPAAEPEPTAAADRIVLQYPLPAVDDGRYPVKRCVGDTLRVEVDAFRDGHELIRVLLAVRGPGEDEWRESDLVPLDRHLGGVRWQGSFTVERIGRWEYTFRAFTDPFATWRDELERKLAAGQDELRGELSEGVALLEHAARAAAGEEDRRLIEHARVTVADQSLPESARHDAGLGDELYAAVARSGLRPGLSEIDPPLRLEVDRLRARFGSWYEMFPRSWGGLRGVQEQLPRLAELGFDVVYLPPIHPIGQTNRKGANNALTAAPGDPGSPWAIGDASGGHEAIHPELGTHDDLRALTAAARELDLEIALDFAIQASADHPWLTEHPEWFHRRPDGTLKYAENPPKRYQDIYNVNWESEDWRGLWAALLDVVLGWVDCGIKVFRVDNPHTKPFGFWAWLIDQVHARDREVVFLAEAFTRRAVMRHLAKIGFSQSYTYFTWKNARWELVEYVSELAYSGEQEYFRPNFFANTPDILHPYLAAGGRPAFETRAVLAATLSPTWGIYSGFESVERVPVRPGTEEYLDSEKYEIKQRRLDGELLPLIAGLNRVRRAHPALRELSNVTFLDAAHEDILAFAKQTGADTVIVVVSLDPHGGPQGSVTVPAHLGLPPSFTVRDELTGESFAWRIGANYVGFHPDLRQAHVFEVGG